MTKSGKIKSKFSFPKIFLFVVATYTFFFLINSYLPHKTFPLPTVQFQLEPDPTVNFPLKYSFCYSFGNFITDGKFIPFSEHCLDDLSTDENGYFTLPLTQVTADIRFAYFFDLYINATSPNGDRPCWYALSFRPYLGPFESSEKDLYDFSYGATKKDSTIIIKCQRDPLERDVIKSRLPEAI